MKRYIHASSEPGTQTFSYIEQVPATKHKYRVRGSYTPETGVISAYWTKISPYDDADYVWGYCKGGNKVDFFKGSPGKKVDSLYWHSYDPEDYESFDEYLNEFIIETAKEIDNYNKDIEPRIVHN